MKFILPHSTVSGDLPDAQELMDNFLAIKRYLESFTFDVPDLTTAAYRFYVPFCLGGDDILTPSVLNSVHYIPIPMACTVRQIQVASCWDGAAGAGTLVLSLFKVPGVEQPSQASHSQNATPAVPEPAPATWNNLAFGANDWLKITIAGTYTACLSVSFVIEFKTVVEIPNG